MAAPLLDVAKEVVILLVQLQVKRLSGGRVWLRKIKTSSSFQHIITCFVKQLLLPDRGKDFKSMKKEDGALTTMDTSHGPEGASYLYFVDGKPNAQSFEKYLADHPGAIDLWLGGHTHTTPDDARGGRSHIEKKWGVTFMNVAALTLYHAGTRSPQSRLLSFIPGSKEVKVQCYLHTDHFALKGFYKPAEQIINLNKPFSWT